LEAAGCPEVLVSVYQSTRHHFTEDLPVGRVSNLCKWKQGEVTEFFFKESQDTESLVGFKLKHHAQSLSVILVQETGWNPITESKIVGS
jgi:hypothetical protein